MVNDALSARQTAANNAAILVQQKLEAYAKAGKEIDDELIIQSFDNIANHIIEWILKGIQKEPDNPYIVVYINKGKYDPDDEKYKDFFEKNGFKKSPQGGWNKRIRQQDYNKWLNEEKDGKKINDWITRAFKIKTQIADVQEDGK